jgi:O-antigen ligase
VGTVASIRRLIVPGAFAAVAAAVGLLAGINPALAIGAALGLAFALVVVADLYIGVVLFTLLTFVAQVPGLGSEVTFAKVAGLLLVVSWLAVLTTREDARIDLARAHPGLTYAFVFLLTWTAISQVWATETSPVLDAVFRLSLNMLLVFIVFTAVRTKRQALGVVGAFVAGAAIAAVYGLVFVSPETTEDAARLSSGLDNPNELATILVAAIALSIGLARALADAPLLRLAVIGAAALCLTGVLLTGSRGGLVALAVALVAFVIIEARIRARLVVVIVVVALAVTGYYSHVASPELRERVSDVSSGSGRTDLWEVAWRMVEDRPVAGVGAGNFVVNSPRYVLEPGSLSRSDTFIESPRVAHNTYLQEWAELGTIGLVLLLAVAGFGLYAAARAIYAFDAAGETGMASISRAVFVALLAVLAADFFGSRLFNKELWLLLGLAAALATMAGPRRRALES